MNTLTVLQRQAHGREDVRAGAVAVIGLTGREQFVLNCFSRGIPDAEIASQLHIAKKSVQRVSDEIRDKLNARTRAHAVAIYLQGDIANEKSSSLRVFAVPAPGYDSAICSG